MRRFALCLAVSLSLGLSAQARESPTTDAPGARDHAVLKRFEGSLLVGYAQADWAATSLPSSKGLDPREKKKFADPVQVEGKVTRLSYLSPLGKSPLEVFRNYQQALLAAGFKPRWSCEQDGGECSGAYFAVDLHRRMDGMALSPGALVDASNPRNTWDIKGGYTISEGRTLAGRLQSGTKVMEILLYTSWAASRTTQRAATYIEIVEPKPMPTGQVTVDAKAIGEGLVQEGKVSLYGLLFDTGKTELKAESAAQLDAMVATLKEQPVLNVLIVGHTDNVGSIDANLQLSQGRAQAVVAALTQRGIAASRLQARGVANFAPVASNAAEEGRARNRRVEMVVR